jgi:hypothetical protein
MAGLAFPDSDRVVGRSDSGGFGQIRGTSQRKFGVFHSLYGHTDPAEMDSGSGRVRSRIGFGRIRADSWTRNWSPRTQVHGAPRLTPGLSRSVPALEALNYDEPLSNVALNLSLRRYILDFHEEPNLSKAGAGPLLPKP